MGALNWSPVARENAVADAAIGARDGASAREFPGLTRGVMAGVAAVLADQGGALVSEGADNAYVVTTTSGVSTLKAGVSLSFWADRDNTGEPSLNVDGSGPRRWRGPDGLSLPAGSIQRGLFYTVVWTAGVLGTLAEWRLAAGGTSAAGGAGVAFDFSGTPAERALYDAQPKGKTYLSVADTPTGPAWTLFLKRSNTFGDWSAGLPIKASTAQSTAEAQAAAEAAALQSQLAAQRATEAQAQAVAAASERVTAAAQAGVSTTQAGLAATQAGIATAAANEAAYLASLVGALSYDMGTLDQPEDGSANFDFGSL